MSSPNTTENQSRLRGQTTAPANVGSRKPRITYFRDRVERSEGYVPGYQPIQTDAVKLNTNENPYPPSPAVMKVLAEMKPDQLRRYPDPQANAFRAAAAEINGLEPDNILCCKGGDELLSIAMRAFCDANRPVAYPVPTYSLLRVLANLQNCEILEIPFTKQFDVPAGLAATGAALTVVCNPNAPTATWIPAEGLASLADKLTGVLLIDEAYVDFAANDAAGLVRQFDNVVVLRSMSKGYSLAGLRFGYAIAHKDLITGLMKIKGSYNVGAIAIAAATAAIKDQAYFKANIEKVKRQRRLLTEHLRALGFCLSDSHTNFVLARAENGSAAAIHEQLVRRNIYVRYFNAPGLRDRLRISIGTEQQNNKLLAALRDILSS
ncbi:MAG: histidinol-phosphate transaminase [Planctomycetota bacterium]|jgi:histidinol-phosphate aminotransferase